MSYTEMDTAKRQADNEPGKGERTPFLKVLQPKLQNAHVGMLPAEMETSHQEWTQSCPDPALDTSWSIKTPDVHH